MRLCVSRTTELGATRLLRVDRPVGEVCPPCIRSHSNRMYFLRHALNIAQLIDPHRWCILHQNAVSTAIQSNAWERVHLPDRAIYPRGEGRIAIRCRVIAASLDLRARPFLAYRGGRRVD